MYLNRCTLSVNLAVMGIFFECVVHHWGSKDVLDYLGFVSIWKCNLDGWCYYKKILAILGEMGYPRVISMWYNDST